MHFLCESEQDGGIARDGGSSWTAFYNLFYEIIVLLRLFGSFQMTQTSPQILPGSYLK